MTYSGGSFNDADGRKKSFVRQLPDETSDEFATRAMRFFLAANDGHILDKVFRSCADDWEKLESEAWLAARNWAHPMLRMRVIALPTNGGVTVGHLVIECDGEQVAYYWGGLVGRVFLPRTESGTLSSRDAGIWSLVHDIKGLVTEYEWHFRRAFSPNFGPDEGVPPQASES